jgi:exoribonuclease R
MTQTLKFSSQSRDYSEWCLYDASSLQKVDKSDFTINPKENKLFNQDIFSIDEQGRFGEIIHSCNREMPIIPGVMIFDKILGKVQPKQAKSNTKHRCKTKFYYQVIPDDKRLPPFKVPASIEKTGFNKNKKNEYVIIKFNHWRENMPVGQIVQRIGVVSELSNYYEYQLYCKSLYASIQNFTKTAIHKLKQRCEKEMIEQIISTSEYQIEDRRDPTTWEIITIDSEETKDYDDAFGFRKIGNFDVLSIYISNVAIWMNYLDIWNSFSQRVSTIYLPDRKRPMMPTVLSDMLCSLVEQETRFAFALDIYIENNEIIKTDFKNVAIKISKNYTYNGHSLLNNRIYTQVFDTCVNLQVKRLNKTIEEIINSNDVVTFIMMLMNYICAIELKKNEIGIFRMLKYGSEQVPDYLPKKVNRFLKGWYSSGSQYVKFQNLEPHDMLELESYVHITSPIRRLVDLLNITLIQVNYNLIPLNNSGKEFLEYWLCDEKITYINSSMKAIRKLQNSCTMLSTLHNNPDILNKKFEGYIIERVERNDALYQYIVFIPELQFMNKYTCRNSYEKYTKLQYYLYLFQDESSFQKKIMLGFE